MQIYLHHYIWYIFSSATLPIINFRGIVHTENEHSFVVYSIRTRVREHMFVWIFWIFWQFRIFNRVYNILYTVYEHTFVFAQPHTIVVSHSLSNCRSCEKAASRELQRSCDCIFTRGEGAAFYFRFKKAAFSFVFRRPRPKFDKKNQIFSKSCDKNKNLKKFLIKIWL